MISPPELCLRLGQRLKHQRLARLMSQVDLAGRADVAVGTVRKLEATGQSSTDSLARIALALGLGDELAGLFTTPLRSIADMERADQASRQQRQRAPRRTAD